jgi:DNA (cytosine-5)-methyltransferase 1
MYELALFAGAGGGLLASKLLGWRTILAVEVEPYKVDVLAARQNDGAVDLFPVWDDVRTFSAHNPETVDAFVLAYKVRHRLVISGGFPCTDISVSGSGIGIDGEASGLWVEMARVVSEIRPAFAFV